MFSPPQTILRVFVAWALAAGLALLPASAWGLDTKLTDLGGFSAPQISAVNPVTNRIYVADGSANTVTIIDGATNSILATVPTGVEPVAIAVNPASNQIYTANRDDGTLTVIDGATNAATTLAVGGVPQALAINSVTNTIYVADLNGGRLIAVDGGSLATTSTSIPNPAFLSVNPATDQIFVGSQAPSGGPATNVFTIVDGTNLAKKTPIALTSTFVDQVLNVATNRIYLSNSGTGAGTVTVLDGTAGTASMLMIGNGVGRMAVNAATNKIYVVNPANAAVTVINGATGGIGTVSTGAGSVPSDIAINPVTDKVYVALSTGGSLAVIDGTSNTLLQTVTAGATPTGLAVNPLTNRVYVADHGAAKVSVIDGNTDLNTLVNDADTPGAVSADPVTNRIFVADSLGLKALDGTTDAVTPLALGISLDRLAANPADGRIYGLNLVNDTITVIDSAGLAPSAPVHLSFQGRYVVAAGNNGGAYVYGDKSGLGAFAYINPGGSPSTEVDDGAVLRSIAVNPSSPALAYVLSDTHFGVYDLGSGRFAVLGSNPSGTAYGTPSQLIAVDGGLNRVYFSDFANSRLIIWDAAGQSFLPPLTVGNQPVGVAVNQLTHQVYVACSGGNSVTVVNGQSLTTASVPIGVAAVQVVTDDARNRAYVLAADGTLGVLAGGTLVETLPNFGGDPSLSGLTVNPLTGKVYSFDATDKFVPILTPAVPAQSGLATYISPLVINTSYSANFSLALSSASLYGPYPVPSQTIYYQVDSQVGVWNQAGGDGEDASASLQNLPFGVHTLFAFATAGEDAAAGGVGQGCSPVVGQVAAYSFIRGPGFFHIPNPTLTVVDNQSSVQVTVLRGFSDPATLDYQTVPLTAVAGVNYLPVHGTLVFAQGETSKTITIPILNQDFGPPAVMFAVAFANPSGGNQPPEPTQAVITVLDDHSPDLLLSQPSFLAPPGITFAGGSITANLTPTAGQWRLFGELAWRASGSVANGLAAGNYVIQFQPMAGFATPAQQSVPLAAFQPATVSATYTSNNNVPTHQLTVALTPAGVGGWRLQSTPGETAFRPGGSAITNLAQGTYLVEFQAVAGQATPPSQAVTIDTVDVTASATYRPGDSTVGAAPVLVADSASRNAPPYQFLGQIQTDQGIGTGFVPLDRVVATAGHLLFDEGALTYTTGVRWLFQRSAGNFESPPQIPRGTFLFKGYTDGAAGAAQQLDAAAMYFLEPAGGGGSGGWLGSNSAANPWLTGSRLKLLAGYPSEGVTAASIGHLFATSPALAGSFAFVSGALFQTTALTGYPGMSGGPVCVRFEDGNFYPAAIYLGGTPGATTVRAIDSQMVDLMTQAEIAGSGGANNVGGGVTQTSNGLTGSAHFALASVQVTLGPPGAVAAGARWHLLGQSTLRGSGQLAQGLSPGSYTVQFAAVPGYTTPASAPVSLSAGNEKVVVGAYLATSPPTITSALKAQAIRGQPFRYQIVATFEPTGFTQFNLPDGLTLNTSTGLISGTPTKSSAASLNVTLVAINSHGPGAIELSLTVAEPGFLAVSKVGLGSVPAKFAKPTTVQAVGSLISIKATPAAGYLFDGWRDADTGAVLSTLPTYTFTMPTLLDLQANFIVNPFRVGKGAYTGLLQGGTYDLSGMANIMVAATGSFTASFNLGGSIGTVKNSFNTHGHYDGGFTLANNRLFSLSLDLGTGGILTGAVTDVVDAGQVPLGARRAAAAPKGVAGVYTAAFPLANLDPSLPGGTGFGRFTVTAAGAVTFTGTLGADTRDADKPGPGNPVIGALILGTPIMVAGHLDASGAWPFFLPPGRIPQTVLGTLTPNAAAHPSFSGSLQWLRAPASPDHLYPDGFFASPLGFTSSRFAAPALVPTLKTRQTLSVELTFNGGDLAGPALKPLTITRAGAGTAFMLNQATGIFNGTFFDPTLAAQVPFRGVILQAGATGAGFFSLPDGGTGAVLLQKQ